MQLPTSRSTIFGAPARHEWYALLALVLAAVFWSENFIAGRALRDDIGPVTLNFLRWAICLALFLPLVGAGSRVIDR